MGSKDRAARDGAARDGAGKEGTAPLIDREVIQAMFDELAQQMGVTDGQKAIAAVGEMGLPMLLALSEQDQLLPMFVASNPSLTVGDLAEAVIGYEDLLVELLVGARAMRREVEDFEADGDLSDPACRHLGDRVLELLEDFKESKMDVFAVPESEVAARIKAVRQQMGGRKAA